MSATRSGGAPARRAILRWGWRLFRREWRQQILVLTLLTVAVATATFSGAFAYTFPRTQDSFFGSANQRISFNATTRASLVWRALKTRPMPPSPRRWSRT